MSWKTEAQKIFFDAGQFVRSGTENVSNYFSSLVSGAVTEVGSLMNGSSVIGINANEIPNMQRAIKEYVKNLEDHLNRVATDADTNQAFKGEYATAIRDYVTAITIACKAVISQLLAFSDQLEEVRVTYEKQNSELASAIKGEGNRAESAYTNYQPKY